MHFLNPILPLGVLLRGTEQKTNMDIFQHGHVLTAGCLPGAKLGSDLRGEGKLRLGQLGDVSQWPWCAQESKMMPAMGAPGKTAHL